MKRYKRIFYEGKQIIYETKDVLILRELGFALICDGKGRTRNELSEHSGMTGNFIGFVERGERSIALKNIVNIHKALGCQNKKTLREFD